MIGRIKGLYLVFRDNAMVYKDVTQWLRNRSFLPTAPLRVTQSLEGLSNHTVVHARTPYEDFEDKARRRHLLRLWLSLE